MNIPRDFIDLLLTRVDLVELIHGFVPLRKKSGSNHFACCPFHNEKSASFSVSQTKQFYYCFGCGAHGNAIDFVMKYEHFSFPEAVQHLAQIAGLELPGTTAAKTQSSFSKESSLLNLYKVMASAGDYFYQRMRESERAIAYLKSRGITGSIAKRFCIGYANNEWDALIKHLSSQYNQKILLDAGLIIKKQETQGFYDRFRDRIMFPIHDHRGRVIGFGGRTIDQGEPKYLNSPETPLFQKGRELYGLHQVLKSSRKIKYLLLVEGYMDVIALVQHGLTHVVATLGTATTTHHIQRILRYTHNIIFCFDGDAAGRTAAWRAVQTILPIIHDDMVVKFLFLPEGEDPDTLVRKLGKEVFEKLIDEAISLSNFFFQTLIKENDTSQVEGRARLAANALALINQMPQGMYQTILLEELSKRTRTDLNDLKFQLKSKNAAHFGDKKNHSPTVKTNMKQQLTKSKVPSPMRLASTLLIQNPRLAIHLQNKLPPLNFKGASFFAELVAIIQNDPHITTGRLIEHWRDQKEGKYIATLANAAQIVPEKGIEQEFLGAIKKLYDLGLQAEIDRLLSKAAATGLTQDEKQRLSEWIGKKKVLHQEIR